MPNHASPDLPLEIWLEIFQFATYIHRHATITPIDPFISRIVSNNAMGFNTPSLSIRTKLSLVLVCRSWRAVALQILYNYIVIQSPTRAGSILAVLRNSGIKDEQNHVGYGQWTRHIEIFTHARGTNDVRYLQVIFSILQKCPNLRMLSGTWFHPLPVEFLDAISKLYGPSLQGLCWDDRSSVLRSQQFTTATPGFLASFRSLHVLDLRGYSGQGIPGPSPSPPTLPKVEDLIISDTMRSLEVATGLVLPALRNLVLNAAVGGGSKSLDLVTEFLKAHGSSLLSVDLLPPLLDSSSELYIPQTIYHINPEVFLQGNLCPNLITITFPVTSPPLSPNIKHPLRRIGLRGVRVDGLRPDKETSTQSHLTSFTSNRYPNLEVIRTVEFLVDADTDSFVKDIFIWWVEKFDRQGVDFVDGEGVLWTYADS